MKSINPKNNKVLNTFELMSLDDVDKILVDVHHTWNQWKETSFEHRAKLMRNAARVLREEKQQFALHITQEMGKPIKDAIAEIEKSALVCDYYADHAADFLADEDLESPATATRSLITYAPLGPVLAVMPWNYPFWQVFRFAAPALMAGNAGLLKHSSYVPQCALDIEYVFKKAGFPDNLFRTLLVSGSSGAVEHMINSDYVAAATLTGSEGAGSKVAECAGKNIKKVVLELGGSDPYIVLQDADVEKAIATAVHARFQNAGQSCIAGKRFFVHRSLLSQFTLGIENGIKQLKYGDPELPDTDMGPMCRSSLRDEIHTQIEQAVAQGVELITGGLIENEDSAYYPPTLCLCKDTNNILFQEETFGPVFAICPFDTEEEAVALANESIYGLGGSLWCKDTDKALQIAKKIETGAVFINSMTKSDPRLPFGGIKKSGYGRELSHLGIREFVNIKTVSIA